MDITSFAKGKMAELWAKNFFLEKGYTCLSQRYKTPFGEIDLILEKENEILFVEVKQRKTVQQAVSCLSEKQIKRCHEAAVHYLQKVTHPFSSCRLDALFYGADRQMEYIPNILCA